MKPNQLKSNQAKPNQDKIYVVDISGAWGRIYGVRLIKATVESYARILDHLGAVHTGVQQWAG